MKEDVVRKKEKMHFLNAAVKEESKKVQYAAMEKKSLNATIENLKKKIKKRNRRHCYWRKRLRNLKMALL